jgi:hypothetical protein
MRIHAAALVLGIAVVAGAVYYYRTRFPSQDLRQADGWTVLQAVEARHRGDQDSREPIFMEHAAGSSFTMLGLPTDDAHFPLAWIIVNEHTADGSFKMLPKVRKINVSCGYLDGLAAKTEVVPGAAKYLRSICTG